MKADMPRPSPSISNFASTSKLPSATIFQKTEGRIQPASGGSETAWNDRGIEALAFVYPVRGGGRNWPGFCGKPRRDIGLR
jgi:hypothetical protein